jgi:hypothetical protein
MKPYTFYFEVYGKKLKVTVNQYNRDDAFAIARRKVERKVIGDIVEVDKPEKNSDNFKSDDAALNDLKRFFGMT